LPRFYFLRTFLPPRGSNFTLSPRRCYKHFASPRTSARGLVRFEGQRWCCRVSSLHGRGEIGWGHLAIMTAHHECGYPRGWRADTAAGLGSGGTLWKGRARVLPVELGGHDCCSFDAWLFHRLSPAAGSHCGLRQKQVDGWLGCITTERAAGPRPGPRAGGFGVAGISRGATRPRPSVAEVPRSLVWSYPNLTAVRVS